MKKKRIVNLSKVTGPPKIRNLEGRPHYVLPVRILKAGVINGNPYGKVLYRERDMDKYASAWDYKPIVASYHRRSKKGKWMSVMSPDFLSKKKVGVLLNNIVRNGVQEAEAWIDIERIRQVEPRIQDFIDRGWTMEVSTGLDGDLKEVQGLWKGQRYNYEARNYRPDHLALLLDKVGACSVKDGCGMFTSNSALSPKKMKEVQKALNNALKEKSHTCSCHKKGRDMKTKKKSSKKNSMIKELIAANAGWEDDDRPMLKELKTSHVRRLLNQANETNSKAKKLKKKIALANSSGKKKGKVSKVATKKQLRKTLMTLPGPMREILSNGLAAYGANRKRLEDVILGSDDNEFTKKELRNEKLFPLKRLRKLAKIVIANSQSEDDDDIYSDFIGAAGAPIANASREKDAKDHPKLVVPAMDYSSFREDDE